MDEQTRILIQEGAKLGLQLFLNSMAQQGKSRAEILAMFEDEYEQLKRNHPSKLPDV